MNLVQGKPLFDESCWCMQMFHFQSADGNWCMKTSTSEGYDPARTFASLSITPPGLVLYRQAIPHGDLRWTLHLLQSDHWQWVNPILEFSDTEETD